MRFVLVTGASTGLGEQICKCLAGHGYHILAGIRNMADGIRLVSDYGSGIHPLLLDVTDQDMVTQARQAALEIMSENPLVAIINNAGIVVNGACLYIPIQEWQRQFDVNLYGVIRVTNTFFPLLTRAKLPEDDHPRRIINMSSVSGLFSSPFIGPYSASKFALEAMSDALRRELYMHDVQVVLLEPGNIRTPIWNKAKDSPSWLSGEYESIRTFKDRLIDRNIETGYPVEILDPYVIRAVRAKRVKVRYLIRGEKWKFRLTQLLPVRWVDRMIAKRLKAGANVRPF